MDPKALSQLQEWQALGPAFQPLTACGLLSPELSRKSCLWPHEILENALVPCARLLLSLSPAMGTHSHSALVQEGIWHTQGSARVSPPSCDPKPVPSILDFWAALVLAVLELVVAEAQAGDSHLLACAPSRELAPPCSLSIESPWARGWSWDRSQEDEPGLGWDPAPAASRGG